MNYRNKKGEFITKKQFEKQQNDRFNENITCIKITAKIMIVVILVCSILKIVEVL